MLFGEESRQSRLSFKRSFQFGEFQIERIQSIQVRLQADVLRALPAKQIRKKMNTAECSSADVPLRNVSARVKC